jgi:hypothetical protein
VSFSFSAGGSLEETLASLNSNKHDNMSDDGKLILGLVVNYLKDAPAEISGRPIPYSVSASGHRGSGTPSLNIMISAPYSNPSMIPNSSAGGI